MSIARELIVACLDSAKALVLLDEKGDTTAQKREQILEHAERAIQPLVTAEIERAHKEVIRQYAIAQETIDSLNRKMRKEFDDKHAH